MPPRAANRTSRRAPLNLRTTEELRAKLEKAAEAAGQNLTQEVERRIEKSFEWEEAFGDARSYLSEQKLKIDEVTDDNFKMEMRKRGWTPKHGSPYWAEPGTFANATSGFGDPAQEAAPLPALPPAGQPLDEDAVYRAVLRALRDARSQDLGGEKP